MPRRAGAVHGEFSLFLRHRISAAVARNGGRGFGDEDAHWADGATLDLVRFLARRIGGLPLGLVISYRDDELAPTDPLARHWAMWPPVRP